LKQFRPEVGVAAICKDSVFKRDVEQVCALYTHAGTVLRWHANAVGATSTKEATHESSRCTRESGSKNKERDEFKKPVIVLKTMIF